ncbi:MAG TPA: cytochrome c biogenesis protein [Candidatus Aminicenantes bacterium]|jgi:cytochrome c-type biogenesis protein CcsB|nr:MAG: Cytochrome c biogenesis protein CcsA [Candidatus Aminicenantes bacterium ADurb.Bin147]HPH44539.1 cytochrome c biogenesis protein [Candidatus Aminicenantes bacterium]
MTESAFFTIAFALYAAAALLYLAFLFGKKPKWARAAFIAASVGLALHTVALVLRTFQSGHAPFTNMYESMSFLAWASVLAFIIIETMFKIPKVGAYVMLFVIAIMALASSPLMPKEAAPLVPALQSYWLWLHVSVTLLGEAFFAVAFITSIMYLRAKDPEKKAKMDSVSYRCVSIGFPLFTLGGLIFGMVWAEKAWGTYWNWDPKEVWSLITWFVFALYLHTRIVMGWKGKRSAFIAILGFLAALFTFFGVNYLLSGLHSYV